jgi:hypothetical protein
MPTPVVRGFARHASAMSAHARCGWVPRVPRRLEAHGLRAWVCAGSAGPRRSARRGGAQRRRRRRRRG